MTDIIPGIKPHPDRVFALSNTEQRELLDRTRRIETLIYKLADALDVELMILRKNPVTNKEIHHEQ